MVLDDYVSTVGSREMVVVVVSDVDPFSVG